MNFTNPALRQAHLREAQPSSFSATKQKTLYPYQTLGWHPGGLEQEACGVREFFRDYLDGRLLQYQLAGDERAERGAIVFCEDGSGSMSGQRELWAKAIGLCFLHYARQEGRAFHAIHFGYRTEMRSFDFATPGDFTPDKVLDFAETHFAGCPLRLDQRVATPEGWKRIGDAQVGDLVFGPDGKPTRIIGVYPQGELDLYKVTFSDGAEVVCDGSHLWTVDQVGRRGRWKTRTLNSMLDKGLQYVHSSGTQCRFSVPITAPLDLPEVDLPLDPYLLGTLIGNGNLTGTSPSISSAEDEFPWADCLANDIEVHDHEHAPGYCYSWQLVAGRRGTRVLNPVTEALRDLGLWGHDASSKFIPDQYLWASKDQRFSLLQGLCDTDGSIDNAGRVEYGTISKKLANDVAQLAHSMGCLASVHPIAPRRSNERTFYKVMLRIPPAMAAPFRLSRYVQAWAPRKRFVRSIVSAERVDRAEAICIEVDGADGLFLTEGMVVTHNTDFERPLAEAIKHLQAEEDRTGRVEGDIVFCTDGQAQVRDTFMSDFKAEQDRMGVAVWGITIGGAKADEPLASIADGHVATVADLTGATDVRRLIERLSGETESRNATQRVTSDKKNVSEPRR